MFLLALLLELLKLTILCWLKRKATPLTLAKLIKTVLTYRGFGGDPCGWRGKEERRASLTPKDFICQIASLMKSNYDMAPLIKNYVFYALKMARKCHQVGNYAISE